APVTVVVSAMGGVTDALLAAGRAAIAGDPSWIAELAAVERRHRDTYRELAGGIPAGFDAAWHDLLEDARRLGKRAVMPGTTEAAYATARFSGWGERLAVPLFAAALDAAGIPAQPFPAEPVLLETRASAGETPRPSVLATRGWLVPQLARLVMRSGVPVLPGYIARDASGRGTTLGRNGSDHSAAVIAAALGAESVYIYSDVAGFYTADPRVVADAALLPVITYAEAAEVAWLGARVLHPRTLAPLAHWGIPLYLRSSFAPDAPGTDVVPAHTGEPDTAWIVAARPSSDVTERHLIEVSATLLGDALRTLDDGEPLLAGVARILNAAAPALTGPLDVTPRQLRTLVSPDSAEAVQRTIHAALVRLGSIHARTASGNEAPPVESEVI
ncbi:MAG: hypothetical protein ACRDHP_19120, partial [Ktedonobacterales bacterium]